MDSITYHALGRVLAYLAEQSGLPRYISVDYDILTEWMSDNKNYTLN